MPITTRILILGRIKEKMNESYSGKKKLCLLLLFIICLPVISACQNRQKITLYAGPINTSNIDLLINNGDYDTVLTIYEKQLSKAEKDSNEEADYKTLIGDLYASYILDRDKAISNLNDAIEIYSKNKNNYGLADAYYGMSNIYVTMGGSVEEGIEYADKAEELYKKDTGNTAGEVAEVLSNKGMIYFNAERWEEALQNFEAAQKTYESIHVETGYTCLFIGRTLIKLEEYDRAEETFLKAQKLAKAAGKGNYAAAAEDYLGWLYIEKEEYGMAIDIYKKALNFYEGDEKYLTDTAIAYNNMAYSAARSNKTEDANQVMHYAIMACRSIEKGKESISGDLIADREEYKNKLKNYYNDRKPKISDDEFDEWYERIVLNEEDWE